MKNNKGSITIFVLIAMLFFIAILTGIYVSNVNYERTIQSIKNDDTNLDQEYDKASEGRVYNNQDQVCYFDGNNKPYQAKDGNWYWENKSEYGEDLLLAGYHNDMYDNYKNSINFDGTTQGQVKLNNLANKNYTIIMVMEDKNEYDQYYYSNRTSTMNGFCFGKVGGMFRETTSKEYIETEATMEKIQIANVYNAEEGTFTMYINDKEVAKGAVDKDIVANNSTLIIANDNENKMQDGKFKCFQFMLYNRAIEEPEIKQIYKENQRRFGI